MDMEKIQHVRSISDSDMERLMREARDYLEGRSWKINPNQKFTPGKAIKFLLLQCLALDE